MIHGLRHACSVILIVNIDLALSIASMLVSATCGFFFKIKSVIRVQYLYINIKLWRVESSIAVEFLVKGHSIILEIVPS